MKSQEAHACDREATSDHKVQILDHNLILVAHTKLKTGMGSNGLARQSFDMLKICKDRIPFELCLWRKKKEERR